MYQWYNIKKWQVCKTISLIENKFLQNEFILLIRCKFVFSRNYYTKNVKVIILFVFLSYLLSDIFDDIHELSAKYIL